MLESIVVVVVGVGIFGAMIVSMLSLFFGKSNKREDSEGYTRICPTCGKRISAGASRCPYCREELSPIGHAVTEGIMGLLKLLVIFAVVMMILISIAKGGFSWLV